MNCSATKGGELPQTKGERSANRHIMRNGQKRMRGRGGHRKSQNPLTRVYESNGPDVKIRGTASHIAEKYIQLARDAQSSGDPVAAENYFQHAEHYFRIVTASGRPPTRISSGSSVASVSGRSTTRSPSTLTIPAEPSRVPRDKRRMRGNRGSCGVRRNAGRRSCAVAPRISAGRWSLRRRVAGRTRR